MSAFDALLLGHLIGDFLLQTSWMAGNKAKQMLPLLVHSLVYTVSIGVFAWVTLHRFSFLMLVLIFVIHVVLDHRTLVQWWVKKIMRTDGSPAVWLNIVVDQTFHLLALAAVLRLL
ncbi:MAG: DUF3307 domain-containing protein [Desulfitobacteriaceae bacterium]